MKRILLLFSTLFLLGFQAIAMVVERDTSKADLVFAPTPLDPEDTLQALCKGAHDGDSPLLFSEWLGQEYVRLWGIDAPEMTSAWMFVLQPYARESRLALLEVVKGKTVYVDTLHRDFYNRLVVRIWTEEISDVSLYMVQSGNAWAYSKGISKADYRNFKNFQDAAKESNIGLWYQPDPALEGVKVDKPRAPWNWRKKYTIRD